MNHIFERIEERRKLENMPIRHLCALTDIPDATYRNWVHGRSDRADVEVIHKLCVALKMPLEEAVSGASGAPAPDVVEEVQTVNQTPATTQEVDTAIVVLMRTMEANFAAHQEELRLIRSEFAEAMAARESQMQQMIAVKDAQFDRERAYHAERLAESRRIVKSLSVACGLLGVLMIWFIAEFIAGHFV